MMKLEVEVLRILTRLVVSILLIATSSCRTAPETATKAESAEASRSESSVALERCLETMRKSERLPPHDQAVAAVQSCRTLWSEAQCRQAWEQTLSAYPAQRATLVLGGCARAYCPTLSEPKPTLCQTPLDDVDLLDEQTDWIRLWGEFNEVVFARELELEEDAPVAALFATRLLHMAIVSLPLPPESE